MKAKTKILVLAGLLLATLQTTTVVGQATSVIGVTPLPSKSQKGIFHGYFNLQMQPTQVEDLTFRVVNESNHEVTVDVYTDTAKTNKQMQVDYGNSTLRSTDNLPVKMDDKTIRGPRVIVLPPKSKKDIKYQLQMPKKSFEGIVSGGFTFAERTDGKDKQEKDANSPTVLNKYSYVVGFVVSEKDKPSKPQLTLDKVALAQWNKRNALKTTLSARGGDFIKGIDAQVVVINKETKKTVLDVEEKDHNIAPYSLFDWVVPLGDQKKWDPGTYLVKLDIKNKDRKWHFEKELVISDDDATHFNDQDVTIHKDNLWYWLIGLFMIAVVIGLGYAYPKMRAKQKEHQLDD